MHRLFGPRDARQLQAAHRGLERHKVRREGACQAQVQAQAQAQAQATAVRQRERRAEAQARDGVSRW